MSHEGDLDRRLDEQLRAAFAPLPPGQIGELAASALLLASLIPGLKRLRVIGALIAVAVMTGAVSFHLFTPLGIDPNNDGGGLFMMAVVVWLTSIMMLVAGRGVLAELVQAIAGVLVPRGIEFKNKGPLPAPARS